MCSPLPHKTLPDACAEQLRQMILSGELRPGDRLPPERQLARRFEVNRVTLRSALARLAASGLVEVRQGRGYTVRDFHTRGGPDLLPGLASLARQRGELPAIARDLLLVRRQLARAVLERIAQLRPDPAGVHAAVDDFARAASGGEPEALASADSAVIAALLRATGSPVLELCLNPVRAVLAELPELAAVLYRRPDENLAGWRALAAWVSDPDPAGIPAILALLERRDSDSVAALEAS